MRPVRIPRVDALVEEVDQADVVTAAGDRDNIMSAADAADLADYIGAFGALDCLHRQPSAATARPNSTPDGTYRASLELELLVAAHAEVSIDDVGVGVIIPRTPVVDAVAGSYASLAR